MLWGCHKDWWMRTSIPRGESVSDILVTSLFHPCTWTLTLVILFGIPSFHILPKAPSVFSVTSHPSPVFGSSSIHSLISEIVPGYVHDPLCRCLDDGSMEGNRESDIMCNVINERTFHIMWFPSSPEGVTSFNRTFLSPVSFTTCFCQQFQL